MHAHRTATTRRIDGCSALSRTQSRSRKGARPPISIAATPTPPRPTTTGDCDYDEAIKLDPKNASAYNNRGNAKNDKGDGEGALSTSMRRSRRTRAMRRPISAALTPTRRRATWVR